MGLPLARTRRKPCAGGAGERPTRPSFDLRGFLPDGGRHPKWWDVSVSAILDDQGAPSRIVSISRDITARHAADDQLKLFNAELHHRNKNNLATVQAMARATLRNAPHAAAFERDFSDRLAALSATYGLLRNGGDAASLADVIGNELKPYGMGSSQIRLDGPHVLMPAGLAVSVALIVHELTPNACKYGGLCIAGGSLEVGWQVEVDGARPTLRLLWLERNVPSIGEPTRSGFGSKLIDRLVRQHRGRVDRDWTADGLRLQLSLPLP
jgi:two-component sensor histidine kinase